MDKKIILVVDDAAENIQLLSGLLKEKFKVKAATNGEMALAIAKKIPSPDLILLDVKMLEMDGFEVCEKLKSNQHNIKYSCHFVSGNFTDEDVARAEPLKASGFVGKPVDAEKLFNLVNRLFAQDR